MPRRKTITASKPTTNPADWVTRTEMTHNGRTITPGTELTIEGVKGRCRFHSLTTTSTSTWITVFDKYGQWRSFDPDRIRTVHRVAKTRAAA